MWLATTEEHHESLRREFPNMRSIQVLGKKVTGWQLLPVDAPDFEEGHVARLRAHRRQRSSNRQGAGRAGFEIGSEERGEIIEAGSQKRRQKSQEVMTELRRGCTCNARPSRLLGSRALTLSRGNPGRGKLFL